jgi:hypothetical protein
MKDFFTKLVGSRKKPIRIAMTVAPALVPLRLSEWRKSQKLCEIAKAMNAKPEFQAMLAVLKNETPANYPLPSVNIQPSDRIARSSYIEGYHACLSNLEALCRHVGEPKELEATFEEPQT